MKISSQFDGGNIQVLNADDPEKIQLSIPKDNAADFFQWFYFRLTGAKGKAVGIQLTNAGESTYPEGWENYNVVASYDRKIWSRVPTSLSGGSLSVSLTPESDSIYFSYFAPYSMEQHHNLVAQMSALPHVSYESLGSTVDGRDMDMLQVGQPGAGKKSLWCIARQHPGETMAEWWMEGFLKRLSDSQDAVVQGLLHKAVFYVVPNMNPDGSFRGNLRTNALGKNLNREWQNSNPDTSPEVYWVLEKMKKTGVDFCLDVHGDEALPYNFIAGAEGIPSWTDKKNQQLENFKTNLKDITPDFQTQEGYPVAEPGAANLTYCTTAVAHKFGGLAMTLEMPFKDTADSPNSEFGWSPDRSMKLGASCLDAIHRSFQDL